MNPSQKIVCCCRKGQVRSVAARSLLHEMGFKKVLCCGLEYNDTETVGMLFKWADVVLIVGGEAVRRFISTDWAFEAHVHWLNIGQDIWGRYDHPELQGLLRPHLERLVKEGGGIQP